MNKDSAYVVEKARASGAGDVASRAVRSNSKRTRSSMTLLYQRSGDFLEPFPYELAITLISAAAVRGKTTVAAGKITIPGHFLLAGAISLR